MADTLTKEGQQRRKVQLIDSRVKRWEALYRKTGSSTYLNLIQNLTGNLDLDVSRDGSFNQ